MLKKECKKKDINSELVEEEDKKDWLRPIFYFNLSTIVVDRLIIINNFFNF